MAESYRRYGAAADRASVTRPSFSSHLTSEAPSSRSHQALDSSDMHVPSSDFLQREISTSRPGAYGLEGISGVGVCSEPGLGGVTSGASMRTYPPLEEPILVSQRYDKAPGVSQSMPEISNGRPSSVRNVDGPPGHSGESNVLFVDGLPTDCTRREVGHLFRPFVGYKDIRVVHKEPRRSEDKAMVLCFVEFVDSKCAVTAIKALQGYKFDDKKRDSSALKITFAHFPFRHPSGREDPRLGSLSNH